MDLLDQEIYNEQIEKENDSKLESNGLVNLLQNDFNISLESNTYNCLYDIFQQFVNAAKINDHFTWSMYTHLCVDFSNTDNFILQLSDFEVSAKNKKYLPLFYVELLYKTMYFNCFPVFQHLIECKNVQILNTRVDGIFNNSEASLKPFLDTLIQSHTSYTKQNNQIIPYILSNEDLMQRIDWNIPFGKRVEITLFVLAVTKNLPVAFLKEMLARHPHSKELLHSRSWGGNSVLMYAIATQNLETVKFVLNQGYCNYDDMASCLKCCYFGQWKNWETHSAPFQFLRSARAVAISLVLHGANFYHLLDDSGYSPCFHESMPFCQEILIAYCLNEKGFTCIL